MKYELEIETPGWKPASTEECRAVEEYCIQRVGISLYAARQFIRYNAIRRWTACDNGKSVADGAKEWMEFVEEERSVPGSGYWLEELAKEVVELRKTVELVAELLCVVHGEVGEPDKGRVVAQMPDKRRLVEEIKEKVFGRDRRVGGLEREAVDEVEGVESGAERGGAKG